MEKQYDPVNVKLFCVLSYLGPFFVIGYFAYEHDEPKVHYHVRQGAVLFASVVAWVLIALLVSWALSFYPPAKEIISLLLAVGIVVAWFMLTAVGIANAVRGENKPLPFIGEFVKH